GVVAESGREVVAADARRMRCTRWTREAAQLLGGEGEDVGRHIADPALDVVTEDRVVHGGHRGRGALVALAQAPEPCRQADRAGEEKLELEPGGETVPGDGAGHDGAVEPVLGGEMHPAFA